MRKSAVVLMWLLLAAVLTAGSVMAQGIEITKASDSEISGRLASSEVEFFSAEDMPDHVIVEIQLSGDKVVRAEIDYLAQQAKVRSLSQITGKAVPLDSSDVLALASLGEAVHQAPQPGRADEALRRTLLLLSAYPAGETVRISSPPRKPGQQKSISSFCGRTGQRLTGTYTIGSRRYTETAQVGPCYNQGNQCLGRCGPGCGWPSTSTDQTFTQDCLNHDLCTARNGGNYFGECQDEWNAAADDFLFGSDCALVTGTWTDNRGASWNLNQIPSFSASMTAGSCPQITGLGSHIGANVSLSVSTWFPKPGCCGSYTFKGTATSCNVISGTWKSSCGGSGTWKLQRNNPKEAGFLVGEEDENESSPDTSNP